MPGDQQAGRSLFLTLAAITTVTAVISSLGAPLVPSIAEDHDVPIASAQWILTSTMIFAAVSTPVLGRWASGRHRRTAIVLGLGVVLIGTGVAALPVPLGVMILARALQGAGMALTPLALTVARDAWRGPTLVSRLSVLSVATVAGAGLGYPLTTVAADQLGVRGAYACGSALVAITLLAAVRHLPRAGTGAAQPVDLVGAALLSAGTVGLLLGVSQGEHWGWRSAPTLILCLAGPALLIAWARWTLARTRSGRLPLVDLRLATLPGVIGPNVVTATLAVGMYGMLTLVVLLVRADGSAGWGLDRGVVAAGLVLVPYSILSVIGSRLALRLGRRLGTQVLLPLGCAVFGFAMALLALAHTSEWQTLLAMAVGGLGSGFTFSSLPMLIVPHIPQEETSSALAFNQLLRYLGFAVGSAASVALLDALGYDDAAFRTTALILAAVCALAGALVLPRRSARTAPSRRPTPG